MNSDLGEFTRADRIESTVKDLVADLLYYGRKEDEALPRGAIQEAIAADEIDVERIVTVFTMELRRTLLFRD